MKLQIPCPECSNGWRYSGGVGLLCARCDGIGRVFGYDAPGYGCKERLYDRVPGEVVILGNGERARILWHTPRPERTKRGAWKVKPEVTYLGLMDGLTGDESHQPTGYPADTGVAHVELSRAVVVTMGDRGRSVDVDDPMQRRLEVAETLAMRESEPF